MYVCIDVYICIQKHLCSSSSVSSNSRGAVCSVVNRIDTVFPYILLTCWCFYIFMVAHLFNKQIVIYIKKSVTLFFEGRKNIFMEQRWKYFKITYDNKTFKKPLTQSFLTLAKCKCLLRCSDAKSCLTLCDPMDCSMPGFPVFHCLPEFAHVHWVGDAIQPVSSGKLWK